MADINRIFNYLNHPKEQEAQLKNCKTLVVSPVHMRKHLEQMIAKEVRAAKAGKPAAITLKLNSISDHDLLTRLYDAANNGVKVSMIIRGIFSAMQSKKPVKNIEVISIVDEYLEHSRVLLFEQRGKQKMYLSSADWMVRNLDHRLEVAVPILNKNIRKQMVQFLNIQMKDNVKARILDEKLQNNYVPETKKKIRSQFDIFRMLSAAGA